MNPWRLQFTFECALDPLQVSLSWNDPSKSACLFSSFLFFLAIHTSDEKDSPIIINESMLHVWLGQFAWFYWWNSNDDISLWYTPNPLRLADFQPISNRWNRRHGLLFRWTCGRVVSAMMWVAKVLIQQWEKSQRHQARSSWWLVDGLAVFWRFVVEDFWFTVRVAWLIFFGMIFPILFLDGCFDFGCFFFRSPAKKTWKWSNLTISYFSGWSHQLDCLCLKLVNDTKKALRMTKQIPVQWIPSPNVSPSNMLLESSDTNGNISLTITIHAWHIYPHFGLFVW